MKIKMFRNSSLLVAALSLLTLLTVTACNKAERDNVADKTKEAYQDSKAAVAQGWDNLKSYTFDKRSDFTLAVKAHQAEFEAQVSKLRAEYSEEKASASRRAAMNELKESESNYKNRLAALGDASADTWGAARDNVIAAWDRLQASYAKARAD
jgi:uncharacterized protein YciW